MLNAANIITQDDEALDLTAYKWVNKSMECQHGYIPTVPEYIDALGQYKTAIHIVSSLITAALFLFYVEHIVFTYRNTHTVYRRHINWLACFYPVGALMSTLALVVPRAHNICNAVKIVYFSLGIRHFVDLTVVMFGCEKGMLSKLKGEHFDFHVSLLRCFPCIPSPSITKIRLRVLKWMLWQFPYTQTIYFFLEIYWTASESNSRGLVLLNYDYLWLDVFNAVSFLGAIYAFTVLGHLVRDHLHAFNFKRKYATLLLLLTILKVMGLVMVVLGNYDFFPCIPPYINSMVYSHTVLNLVHLVLLTIFGALEYWQYHTEEFLQPISDKHHQHAHELIIHGQACVCIISEMTGTHNRRRRASQLPVVLEDDTLGEFQEEEEEVVKKKKEFEVSSVETEKKPVPEGDNNSKYLEVHKTKTSPEENGTTPGVRGSEGEINGNQELTYTRF
ncbi:organic solute transporter alpha-like protein [Homarus americanus]|uniref:Organic solute transporter subunit alpha-like n=1 Tax=Homarus americanus TaxID=6706 RepID=A0A8J5JND9_HOMAM|nr:organic solute transporter alpha-like protein [Homarus americanus]XP_042239284.1 organic solute transporter alpha-like protein [Homarus americanus]XP_042239285.1 organic solute transporter alpha-like protein [Homarus americanus]KAG7159371.1 Organic solute transporter subunit alpha-like [Homarus americanus]